MLPYRLSLINASLQDRIIASLFSEPAETVTELSRRLNVLRPSCSRSLHKLHGQNLVARDGRRWALSDEGKKAAEALLKDATKDLEKTVGTLNQAFNGLAATGALDSWRIVSEQMERQNRETLRYLVQASMPSSAELDILKNTVARFGVELASAGLPSAFQNIGAKVASSSGLTSAIAAVTESQRNHLDLLGSSSFAALRPLLSQNLVPLSQIGADLTAMASMADAARTVTLPFLEPLAKAAAEVATGHQAYLDDLLSRIRTTELPGLDPGGALPRLGSQEVWSPTFTTSRFVAGARASVEIGQDDANTQEADVTLAEQRAATLEDALARLGPRFVAMWRGAWIALYSGNPDAIRQAMHSGRELLRQVLDVLAPDHHFPPGEKVTRAMRAKFILAPYSDSGGDWASITAKNIETSYSLFCGDAHWQHDEPRFGRDGFVAFLESLGSFLRLLIGCREAN